MAEILTRRGLLKGIAGFSFLRATDNGVPRLLSDSYTTDPKELLGGHIPVVAVAAVNDNEGKTAAIYSLLNYGNVQRVDFDPKSDSYKLDSDLVKVPLKYPTSIAGFSDSGKPGNEKLVVGGDGIAVSSDSAKTFSSLPLETPDGKLISGDVLQIKRIPFTDKAILRVGHQWSDDQRYVIYSADSDSFRLISGQIGPLPLLDDLYVNPDDPDRLFGTGRIERDGKFYDTAINDFEIDLNDAYLRSSTTREDDLPYLVDVSVLRGRDGTPLVTKAIQTIQIEGNPIARLLHRFDHRDVAENNKHLVADLGALVDPMLRDELTGTGLGVNDELLKYNINGYAKNIYTFPSGSTWLTGSYMRGGRPFALYWREDESDPTGSYDQKMFAFEEILVFLSPDNKEPNFVNYWGDHKLPSMDESIHGVLFNHEAGGSALIRTNEDFAPIEAEILYQKRESTN